MNQKNGNMNYYLNGIMGLVVGDALGVPVEFKNRKALQQCPVTDLIAYGTHNQPKGTWSDDSSMTLATLESLHSGYDIYDIADKFLEWYREGAYTPYGEVFDMGFTCRYAIMEYAKTNNPFTCGLNREFDNGNGSLMRIFPICIYGAEKLCCGEITVNEAIAMVHDVSAITHAHLISKICCGLYFFCTNAILKNRKLNLKTCIEIGMDEGFAFYERDSNIKAELKQFERLRSMEAFVALNEKDIESSGYVLDSLETSIWCLLNTDCYRDCVLTAVNLGQDTDTTAAIVGGLAGLYYGYDCIPEKWKISIAKRVWIEALCGGL